MYYIGAFAISLFFILIAEQMFKKKRQWIGIFFSFLGILVITIFSGIRDFSVGTDVETYVVPETRFALLSNSFFDYYAKSTVEPLYAGLIYLCSRISPSPSLALLMSSLCVIVPIYIAIYKLKKYISITMGMTLFYLLFYNLSLSAIRQSIAIAFLMLAYNIYLSNQRITWKIILLALIAFGFHNTSIIAIVILSVTEYISRGKHSSRNKALLIVFAFIAVLNIQHLVQIVFNTFSFLPRKYYIRIFERSSVLSIFDTVFKLLITALAFILIKIKKNKSYELNMICFTCIIGCILQFLSLFSEYLIRITYYFQFPIIIILAYVPTYFSRKNKSFLIGNMGVICIAMIYWFVIYYTWQWFDTIPFKFIK